MRRTHYLVVPGVPHDPNSVGSITEQFRHYLAHVEGLSESTVRMYHTRVAKALRILLLDGGRNLLVDPTGPQDYHDSLNPGSSQKFFRQSWEAFRRYCTYYALNPRKVPPAIERPRPLKLPVPVARAAQRVRKTIPLRPLSKTRWFHCSWLGMPEKRVVVTNPLGKSKAFRLKPLSVSGLQALAAWTLGLGSVPPPEKLSKDMINKLGPYPLVPIRSGSMIPASPGLLRAQIEALGPLPEYVKQGPLAPAPEPEVVQGGAPPTPTDVYPDREPWLAGIDWTAAVWTDRGQCWVVHTPFPAPTRLSNKGEVMHSRGLTTVRGGNRYYVQFTQPPGIDPGPAPWDQV